MSTAKFFVWFSLIYQKLSACACQQARQPQLHSHGGSFLNNYYNIRSSHRLEKWLANLILPSFASKYHDKGLILLFNYLVCTKS